MTITDVAREEKRVPLQKRTRGDPFSARKRNMA